MEWFDPNIEEPHNTTLKGEDSIDLQQGLLHSSYNQTHFVDEYSRSDSLMHPLSDTLQSDEPFIFDYGDLAINNNNNGFNFDNDEASPSTDTHSGESNLQHSSFGSDSAILSQHFSDTDWFKLENPHSQKNSIKYASSSTDGINSTATSGNNEYENGRRSYCVGNSNSKNAVAARDNRQKKKKYIASLEESVRNLRAKNDYLLEQSNKTRSTLSGLQTEVSYLRRVIANQSILSAVLKNVMKTPGIKLSTSLFNTVRSNTGKKEGVTCDTSGYISGKSEKGSSSTYDQSGAVKSTSRPNQITASSTCSKKRSKQNAKGKKVDSHEKIRLMYDHVAEKNITVDIELSGDSDVSTDSFSPDDSISGGICLHVAGQNVSLELCSHCNKNAQIGINSDHSYFKQ